MILLLMGWAAASARAAGTELFVDAANGNDQSGANNCQTQATPCETIGQAVSVAAGGDEIKIAPGTYDEAISTSLSLSFIGSGTSGASATTIDSTGQSAPALLLSGGGSVTDLALNDDDSGIGGALQAAGGTVTAQGLLITTAGTTAGTDAIDVTAGTLDLSDSTAAAINNDADVELGSGHSVVFDGSGLEVSGGSANVSASTLSAVEGIALRVHISALAVNVRDSVITSGGSEDLTGYTGDGWQAIEAGAGALTLTGDTVYNATAGNTSSGQPPADAITVEPVAGITTAIHNTILRSQNNGAGVDVNASEPVSIDHSSLTTVTNAGTTVTNPDDAGNIAGDPQFVSPGSGNFALAAASPLIGAGDSSVVQAGETDVAGAGRALSCPGGVEVVDIGAVETGGQCPAPAPATNPGPASYLYASHASSVSNDYDQFVLGTGGLLSQLSPFEAGAHGTVGTLITGADAPQVYALEQGGSGTVLEQYQVGTGGQLTAGMTIAAPAGSSLLSAALSPNGARLYLAVSSGTGGSQSIAIDEENVSAAGVVTSAGAPTPLPVTSVNAQLAVDDTGLVYALAAHQDGSATLHDYRANADGTLTQEDSADLGANGTLSVAPAGDEAVAVTQGFYQGATNIGGFLYPVGVAAGGTLTVAPRVDAGSQANTNFNNPQGSAYSPSGSTLYVEDILTVTNSSGLQDEGSIVAPFTVNADGTLTPETTTPDTGSSASFPNSFQFDAGLVASPGGGELYVPNDYNEPTSGSVDAFATGTGGALTLAPGAPVSAGPFQTSVVLDTPPPATAVVTHRREERRRSPRHRHRPRGRAGPGQDRR
ncbi:MAG TPA: DUF1565 domain-containing protein [Solirubrobacteraceae bacterium]|nr:DUF1565 domain-containing protein [Solirubrobacteraceae bacterium]